MKKYQSDFKVTGNSFLTENAILLTLQCISDLPEIKAGQFAQLQVPNTEGVMLRRPISIHSVKYESNSIEFLVQLVGPGTKGLAKLKLGDIVNVIYPLGIGFSVDKPMRKAILIGGGVGVAPLLELGKVLKSKGVEFSYLFGGRTDKHLLRLDEFRKVAPVEVSTQDGSMGDNGLVTENNVLQGDVDFDMIFCCGPTPMMKAVGRYAHDRNIACEVSLEHKMACGIGACLCCVEETRDEGNVCICKEGPVFNIDKLKWLN